MKKLMFVIVGLVVVAAVAQADSLNCRLKGNWPFGGSYAVVLDPARNLAFCGSGGGVYVLDVSSPARPVKRSEAIHTSGFVTGVAYDASRLYVAAEEAGLEIWDVSTPTTPVRLAGLRMTGFAYGVAVAGSHAYVTDGIALRVIDVADPQHPAERGSCATPSAACGVAAAGGLAYVADFDSGMRVIDVRSRRARTKSASSTRRAMPTTWR